jgi:ABC-2 type transport system permease protein
MTAFLRYVRLLGALGRYSLANEMAFRGNFLVKISVEVIWLCILLIFYATIFSATSIVAEWTEYEYLFFVGCYFALEGIIETFFLSNCGEFGELVRTGNLDMLLLKPIDEQFLISCRSIDWSTGPNVLMGGGVMAWALFHLGWTWNTLQVLAFLLAFSCAVMIAYGFLLMLTSAGVWMVRNQSLLELWWLVTSLMRYPKEIYTGRWGGLIGMFFWYVLPILLVINVPARTMAKPFGMENWKDTLGTLLGMFFATVMVVFVSRRFFHFALRSYRSASS